MCKKEYSKEERYKYKIRCKCGYWNKIDYVNIYGTCLRCGETLNSKAKFKYEMYDRLKLWRYDHNRRKYGFKKF